MWKTRPPSEAWSQRCSLRLLAEEGKSILDYSSHLLAPPLHRPRLLLGPLLRQVLGAAREAGSEWAHADESSCRNRLGCLRWALWDRRHLLSPTQPGRLPPPSPGRRSAPPPKHPDPAPAAPTAWLHPLPPPAQAPSLLAAGTSGSGVHFSPYSVWDCFESANSKPKQHRKCPL